MTMKQPGIDDVAVAALPATYGGAGFRPRASTHAEDVEAGILWRRCGSRSEVDDLREVMLAWPEPDMFRGDDPNALLFLQWPDVSRMQAQADNVAAFYQAQGVTVHWLRSASAPPNIIFQRDLFFMTPEGAVLARPGAEQRAGEARVVAATLSHLGVPIIAVPRGRAVLEGADALWLGERTVLVGIGHRTNAAGAQFLSSVLRDIGVDVVAVALPRGVQHLLGVVDFIDHDLAAGRADMLTDELLCILREAAIDVIRCGPGPDVSDRFGMNFVTLAPRRVVMPAGCATVRATLADAGVAIHELDISEYVKAAGGLGCLTGIVHRRRS
jgi:N-dimethylarginine dimethylaminohydrolase